MIKDYSSTISSRCHPKRSPNLLLNVVRHYRSLLMPSQICYDICADELPAYEYFGTQYSNEVRSIFGCLALRTFVGRSAYLHASVLFFVSVDAVLVFQLRSMNELTSQHRFAPPPPRNSVSAPRPSLMT